MGELWLQTVVVCVVLGCVALSVNAGTGLYMGPYFPSPLPRNITVHQDTVAYLPCTVKQLGDKSVSWVRQRDADILTVDRYTFVRDERLTVHYTPDTETWTLVIKYVQERDAGTYECQISTEPKMSKLVHLNVIVPQVEIIGAVDKYVRKGSTARLECTVSSTVQLPDYIFWYHSGDRLLEYDHPRVKISVSRRGGQGSEMSVTSTLVITKAMASDDGNYTCLPSNLHSATTILHVLNDEHPAAMQTGAAMLTDPSSPWGILLVVVLAFIFVHAHQDVTVSRRSFAVQLHQSVSDHEVTFTTNTDSTPGGKLTTYIHEEDAKALEVINFRTFSDRRALVCVQAEDLAAKLCLSTSSRVHRPSWVVKECNSAFCSPTFGKLYYNNSVSCVICNHGVYKNSPRVEGAKIISLEFSWKDNHSKNSAQFLQIIPVLILCSRVYVLSYNGSIIAKICTSHKRN